LLWRGPGIQAQCRVQVPVPSAFWLERQRREAFPRGLDVLFSAGHHLLGLPRSSRITQEHA
jgi:alpha-D-ribose 1-methylphosphonate 5-triphosphate synthase subunit PhnH